MGATMSRLCGICQSLGQPGEGGRKGGREGGREGGWEGERKGGREGGSKKLFSGQIIYACAKTLQHTATKCNILHHIAIHCYTLQKFVPTWATFSSHPERDTTIHLVTKHRDSNTLPRTAIHCNTLKPHFFLKIKSRTKTLHHTAATHSNTRYTIHDNTLSLQVLEGEVKKR